MENRHADVVWRFSAVLEDNVGAGGVEIVGDEAGIVGVTLGKPSGVFTVEQGNDIEEARLAVAVATKESCATRDIQTEDA